MSEESKKIEKMVEKLVRENPTLYVENGKIRRKLSVGPPGQRVEKK